MTALAAAPPLLLSTKRGRLMLALLCSVAFLDFVDASITNVALPDIRDDLGFSVQGLQWVPSGYLLTYGGFMLLGGRLADLLGRRKILIAGTVLVGLSSLVGGFAQDPGTLIAARLAQGLGAALMLPAALSILTSTFREGPDRHTALGAWGGVGGFASAVGVFVGGVLTDGPGWRWVMFVNPIACVLVLAGIFRLIETDEPRPRGARFDVAGSVLVTGGMLTLVFALVKAPDQGWASGRTILELVAAAALLGAFLIVESVQRSPLLSLDTLRIKGLAAANVTGLIAFAGMLAMFFFLTLYMQNVLGYSPIKTGLAYLPMTAGVAVSAGFCSQLLTKVGTRPVILAGALIASGGLFYLAQLSADGTYPGDLLPGMLIVSVGLGAVFVGVVTAANAGVPPDKAGLTAALLNSSQQIGGALGLAIFSAIATARTRDLLEGGSELPSALTDGFHRALLTGAVFALVAAGLALRTTNSRGHVEGDGPVLEPAAISQAAD
jgi:EmrB/QacA subfamily drug resistance transporter